MWVLVRVGVLLAVVIVGGRATGRCASHCSTMHSPGEAQRSGS